VPVFRQPHYLENFLQAALDALAAPADGTLVIGGDGRFYNREAIEIALRMAAANGIARAIVGAGGLLSTPAASHLIRKHAAAGGLLFSASHNPGGPEGDFGVKLQSPTAACAREAVTETIMSSPEITPTASPTTPPAAGPPAASVRRHGVEDRSGGGLRGADGNPVRLRAAPDSARQCGSACATTPCTR
jgi:phosphoglucomutase